MATTTGSSGNGSFGDAFTIDRNGVARKRIVPPDARTPAQLRYRQLMRALNRVLVHFGDDTDQDVATAVNSAAWWSSETFRRFAADHGSAINQDLANYGKDFWPPTPTTNLLDDFNRADGPVGPNWHSVGFISNQQYKSLDMADYWAQSFEQPMEVFATIDQTQPDDTSGPDVGIWFSPYKWYGWSASIGSPGDGQWYKNLRLNRGIGSGPGDSGIDARYYAWQNGDRLGLRLADNELTAFLSPAGQAWSTIFRSTDTPWSGTGYIRAGIGHNHQTVDDFGGGTPQKQNTRAQWQATAIAIGIDDLNAPVAPFTYGEAGELLFLVCCRLWRMQADPALPNPTFDQPSRWQTYLETGTYPA
jgi:hypothetical protein